MERVAMKVFVLLAAALLAAPRAEAKGGFIVKHFAHTPAPKAEVECEDVCTDVCVNVPKEVCKEVPVTTKECQQVPVQQTRKECERVCTTAPAAPPPPAAHPMTTGKGKTVTVSVGHPHGRRLLTKGKGFVIHKAVAPVQHVSCQDVCKDVPFTTYTTECKDVTSTKTECETVHEKSCKKECKQSCKEVAKVAKTSTKTISFSKGKGH